ncbi:MAG: circularly permuted type 2 ATP-grasp protein [Pirellulales bacterium]
MAYLTQTQKPAFSKSQLFAPTPNDQVTANFERYDTGDFYDEMFDLSGQPRPDCQALFDRVRAITADDLIRRQRAADRSMLQLGITFNVYGDRRGRERIIPFDIVPRILAQKEWDWLERGLKQRITAINLFIEDVYHDQRIVRDGVVPEHLIATAKGFRQPCVGLTPPRGIWCHITGTDLVRDCDGQFYVLEDNLRVPSGVSYLLQNRQLMKQTFPQLFDRISIRPVDDYCSRLLDALQHLMDDQTRAPSVALLSPGMHNAAYFEHSFLAQQMGIDLVEGRDLVVVDGFVYMRTTKGLERVDVLYRRIDDDFLDPLTFRADSTLGVPGLMEAYRAGRVAIANAPGCGVADDKVIYAYVPQIVKYYLGEDAIIPNVPTYVCCDDAQRQHVLENMANMVVKPANEAGGYGLVVGPHASKKQLDDCAAQIRDNPRNFIGQPVIGLSRVPVLTADGLEGRHVDLRPFIVYGKELYVLPGGLTRVALTKGSYVVNSSQGGGSKDTWVVA